MVRMEFTCICKQTPLLFTKFFYWWKLKTFADDKINVTKNRNSFWEWVENFVGKGENASYQHFLLFPQCFQKLSFPEVFKSWDCVGKT